MKNYIITLICFFAIAGTSFRIIEGSEGQGTEQKGDTQQAEAAEPEKEYELIEETKDYMTTPKQTFLYYCSPCHGNSGNGKGIYFTIDLQPSPRDLTDIEYMAALTDDYLLNFITKGSAAMEKSKLCPPWGGALGVDTIKGLVSYLRGLTIAKSKEGEASAGEEEAAEAKVVVEKEQGTPQAIIWSVLIFICAFLAIGTIREWKKLGKEEASVKK
ncbi:MAG: cytochrome c [Candidatus Brocadiaceae bacterium]|nr:cytochrome c [Candidatus Brocadiaceae bacterium]